MNSIKPCMVTLAFVATLGWATQATSHATEQGKTAIPTAALHAIQENARAAGENAAIYQWKRVNHEVDRIVGDESRVQKALAADSSLAKQSEALRQAVQMLRSARLAHDVDRIEEASEQVITAVMTIRRSTEP